MASEKELLCEFARTRCEAAFAGIVRAHVNMVFATALRQVGDRGLAEEITQDVFVQLTRKAGALRGEGTVGGWLYKTALNQSRARLRSELRRRRREGISAELGELLKEGESVWSSLLPLLDEAMLGLQEQDRVAVLLRFMEERTFEEVGRVFGVGEDAARKRIDRVLGTLADWFRRRGVPVTAGSLAAALAINGNSEAASAGLAASITAATSGAGAGSISLAISKLIMTSTQFKITAGAVALLALMLSAPDFLRHGENATVTSAPVEAPVKAQAPPPERGDGLGGNKGSQAAAAPSKPAVNFFTRLQQGDESLALLSHEQAEAFLAANKTNAESLLAAYQVTRDKEYLRRAAENFPNDPSVLIRAIGFNVSPENRRQMIEQLKKVDGDNALGSYLSAGDHLKNNEYEAALKDLGEAAAKKSFHDYTAEQSQTMEEIYLVAGHTPAEAKALGVSSLELPHLRQVVDVARGLQLLMDQYSQAGDKTSAAALAQNGLALSARLEAADQGGSMRIGEFIGWKMEQGFLTKLDPAQSYPFVEGGVTARLDASAEHENTMQSENGLVSQWLESASDPEIIAYYDRIKLYGEASALRWLKERFAGN